MRIVAAVLDTQNLQLYREDGSKIEIPQGDARLRPLLDKITPEISRQGFAEINLSDLDSPSAYKEFEEKSNGMVKFFKVAKSKLKAFFGASNDEQKPLEPVSVGRIPAALHTATASNDQKMKAALDEIMQHAVPVASPAFNTKNVDKQAEITDNSGNTPNSAPEEKGTDTIIAVINNQVVPGVEKIESQFDKAVATGNTVGMQRFLDRLGSVAKKRNHSANDLLKFMERGDLPIANDGSILIYKVLRRKTDGVYVDCHTQKVPQKVGSYVCMDESLVDHNRNNECSNGLHVARRGYVRGFSGDVCVLAKLAPEDVIAVPTYDANKMRVCGYHIIFELTPQMYALLNQNRPITELPEGKKLLADAMEGRHTEVIEEVRITAHMGGGVKVTPVNQSTKPSQPPAETVKVENTKPLKEVTALENSTAIRPENVIKPTQVIEQVVNLSRKDMAKSLYETYERAVDPDEKATALKALQDYKKSCKVGWDKLGISDPTGNTQAPKAKAPPSVKPTQKTNTKTMTTEVKKPMSARDQIQAILPKFEAATGQAKIDLAHDILKLKQQSKKSWDTLGVSSVQSAQIALRTKD